MKKKHFMQVCESLSLVDEKNIDQAVQILLHARNRGSSVWLAGNGGSAATAAHFANDLVKMCKMKAFDLPSMTSLTLAYGNDHGWERMFANTFRALSTPLDVVVAISCSGNSQNILNLVDAAADCDVIALTGDGGKLMYKNTSVTLAALSDDITVQEDVHSIICHAIAKSLAEER